MSTSSIYISHTRFIQLFEQYCAAVEAQKFPRTPYNTYKIIKSLIEQSKQCLDLSLEFKFTKTYNLNAKEILYLDIIANNEPSSLTLYEDNCPFVTFLYYNLIIESQENYDNTEKEKNNMKFNFDFGPVSDDVRMSPYGMAIKNSVGTYVSYNTDTQQIVDVDIFNFDGSSFMYKIPVALTDVQPGDIIIHNRKPLFVSSASNGVLNGIDVWAGETKSVIPTTNMFGFNFVTKVICFLQLGTPDAANPFGNMWPLFLAGDQADNKQMLMLMFMLSQNSNAPANLFQNPMFMLAMMQDNSMDNMLPMMLAMNMTQHNCKCGSCSAPVTEA